MAMQTPVSELGWTAHDFNLLGVNGQMYTLSDVRGSNGVLVMFICNHCPYVRAIITRLVEDVHSLSLSWYWCGCNHAERYGDLLRGQL